MNREIENYISELLKDYSETDTADILTKALNEAIEAKKAAEEEARKAEEDAKAKKKEKVADFRSLLGDFVTYFKKYYPEFASNATLGLDDVSNEDIEEIIDEIDRELLPFLKMFGVTPQKKTEEPKKINVKFTTNTKNIDDIFNDFFLKNNI